MPAFGGDNPAAKTDHVTLDQSQGKSLSIIASSGRGRTGSAPTVKSRPKYLQASDSSVAAFRPTDSP